MDPEEDIDEDIDEMSHVELKSLGVASCVANPAGCCGCFWIIILVMVGFGVYINFNRVCLSFNFSDFKVINSDISNNFYQKSLSEDTRFNALSPPSRRRRLIISDDDDEGLKRRLFTEYYGYTLWGSTDFYYRAIAGIYLNVFYYSISTNNILTNELLSICHAIEQGIKGYDGYHDHALIYKEINPNIKLFFSQASGTNIDSLYLEAAPGSFLNYIYPQVILGNYVFNGNGDTLTFEGDIESTIRAYKDVGDLTEFFDFSFDFINVSSKYLAAVYPFGYKSGNESRDELYSFVSSYKEGFFDKLGTSVTNTIGVAFSDSRGVILEDELYFYLGKDLNLAIWSLIIIYIVVYLYCRSIYVTSLGLLGVCSSFIPCFAIYYMVWGESFNLVNMVALWVILGIGCDDICVFISSYRRAPLESIDGEIIPNHLRLAFAYREAGAAMFVTSFTTSCSFFSLCLSSINPLPQFGWFLGSLVLTNFVLVMTWFPCIIQSYVWMVMLFMKCKCHITGCTKWLAVAVPLPQQYDHKQDINIKSISHKHSVKVLRRSSNKYSKKHLGQLSGSGVSGDDQHQHSPISDIIDDRDHIAMVPDHGGKTPPIYGRQSSKLFAVPGVAGSNDSIFGNDNNPHSIHQSAPSQLVRQLTRKLDKNKQNDTGGFEAETHFGDCTNLYFIMMRRGLGITLILLVLIITCIFGYTATLITLPQETAKLLPDNTNWGQVNIAITKMDIDADQFAGYSTSSGESTGAIVATGTKNPSKSPTEPHPTNAPTPPTTATPTIPPTSPQPTIPPTLATYSPTLTPSITPTINPSNSPSQPPIDGPTITPTINPSNNPSIPPTLQPTPSPTLPTSLPTKNPSPGPTQNPLQPSATEYPTGPPTLDTINPSAAPTANTQNPSLNPSISPTLLPTTYNPTILPTLIPTISPTVITNNPSISPTLLPTTYDPTKAPSLNPSQPPTKSPSINPTEIPSSSPSLSPTDSSDSPSKTPTEIPTMNPTYSPPKYDDISYECINDDTLLEQVASGDTLKCSLNTLKDANGADTFLNPEQIAFVFEGGGLYGSNDITGCSIYNNASKYYNKTAYLSEYDTKWCYDSISTSAAPLKSLDFDIIAPFAIPSPAWFRLSLWLYYDREWNQIFNGDGNKWYNYSIVDGYSASEETLSVDESIKIYLLFGTRSVSEFNTDCDGEVTSGTLEYDSNFNIYDVSTQQRWLHLCTELSKINDVVMYRKDDEQDLCFSSYFNEYLNNSDHSLPITNRTKFNQYISSFVGQRSSTSFSSKSYDPRDFDSWFGTETDGIWFDNNATIKWIRQNIKTQINKKWGGAAMYEYYQKWEDFIDDFNGNSPSSFQGVQTSSAYIRMEVEVAFLDGFVKSVLYTIILCAIVMIFFTQNLYLVVLVCLYILIICIWVVGLFGALGWPFGIIEIISVPTVVGLTIDYALHITHAYIHSPFPDRIRRAKSAVNDLGSSVFASAMTTICSMFILYFATIIIFSDLGWVVGSTTSFGVALALFVCPPCLMFTGPQYDQCHFSWCCPETMNGIKIGKHRFCSNEWHGKKSIPKEHNKAIELEARKQNDNNDDALDHDQEGTGPHLEEQPGSPNNKEMIINDIDNNEQLVAVVADNDNYNDNYNDNNDNIDDDDDEESLADGWRAVLTDDGKMYYQNDITQKTQWKRPIVKAPAPPSIPNNDSNTIRVPPLSTNANQMQSEPDEFNENDIAEDLPPSYQYQHQPPSANIDEIQEAQFARGINEIEANSEEEDNNNNNESNSDQPYVLPQINAKQTDNGAAEENAATPLVTKGADNDDQGNDDDEPYKKIMAEQANLMQQIQSKSNILLDDDMKNDDNDNDEYVPPAPAPPASAEEIDANHELMKDQIATPGINEINGINVNNTEQEQEQEQEQDEEVELEQSISLDYDPEQIGNGEAV